MADALRMALKAAIESAEVAALWIPDCDDLEMKLSLAEQCGDGARKCRRLAARLAALGVGNYDPRDGGYSKLFAFLRSLQTPEERSSAGYVTGKALSAARLAALAAFCTTRGDEESARLLGTDMVAEERRTYDEGRVLLTAAATTEESQARARRAAYRTLELAGETVEPLALRRSLGRRR
ncbi:MAG TPA: ferritin-like domain-containing protein [Polyangia bacterium]|nr:ferritin-like domain-containing protein [Polyangia bacterium]